MSLYKELGYVYDYMYSRLFDYDGEATFYQEILDRHGCIEIIECGCGTGQLLSRLDRKYIYTGLDLSSDMLALAHQRHKNREFVLGDVTNYKSDRLYDAALLTGRTISYLTEDGSVEEAFENVASLLRSQGMFIFDVIDGPRLFAPLDTDEKIIDIPPYRRSARSYPMDTSRYLWRWTADYSVIIDDQYVMIGQDDVILRAFDIDVIQKILEKTGFEVLDVVAKKSYIWDDHYVLSRKKG
jgi:SAM-dependent methyltransferase